jgi:hypothetical protein
MYDQEKSDSPIVPENPLNKYSDNKLCEEAGEERGELVRNTKHDAMLRTQSRDEQDEESL